MPKKTTCLSDEQIAAAVMECRTLTDAANRLNISQRTLYDRMQSYQLQSILSVLRAEQLKTRLQSLTDAEQSAVECVTSIMRDEKASAHTRLKAAWMILEAGRAARQEISITDAHALGQLRNADRLEADRNGDIVFAPLCPTGF